ncbi:hypothetical protein [Enterovibrio coralii]|nr:hypothetical protein [Enterovibrio coralii]
MMILLPKSAIAFNGDYESKSSRIDGGLLSPRMIFNAPYSLCRADGISDADCGSFSLDIGGETFKATYYSESAKDKDKAFYSSLSRNDAEKLERDYILEGRSENKWKIPTLGQLENLYQRGLIRRGQRYWYRADSNGALKLAAKGYTDLLPSTGAIDRLVTDKLSSNCSEDTCNGWNNLQPWVLQTATGSSFAIRYDYGYKQGGRNLRWSKQWGANNLPIPGDATEVWIEIWHNGSLHYSGKNYHIERERGTANVMCIKQYGSLAVHSAELKRGACW